MKSTLPQTPAISRLGSSHSTLKLSTPLIVIRAPSWYYRGDGSGHLSEIPNYIIPQQRLRQWDGRDIVKRRFISMSALYE
ncbi:hypothetical protein V490_03801 [Pseudogymnoascus sp. VKM F-3557]|nr:hypothetical protein V490_03801 [Pseudogymnoascus sp. VKM F-3557]